MTWHILCITYQLALEANATWARGSGNNCGYVRHYLKCCMEPRLYLLIAWTVDDDGSGYDGCLLFVVVESENCESQSWIQPKSKELHSNDNYIHIGVPTYVQSDVFFSRSLNECFASLWSIHAFAIIEDRANPPTLSHILPARRTKPCHHENATKGRQESPRRWQRQHRRPPQAMAGPEADSLIMSKHTFYRGRHQFAEWWETFH